MTILSKNTTELVVGDLVRAHGAVFRVRDRQEAGAVVWFRTDVVEISENCSIPPHWIDGWTIQGNAHAYWHVVAAN
jgi:hypothetical protein